MRFPENAHSPVLERCFLEEANVAVFEGCFLEHADSPVLERCFLEEANIAGFESCFLEYAHSLILERCFLEEANVSGSESCFPEHVHPPILERCILERGKPSNSRELLSGARKLSNRRKVLQYFPSARLLKFQRSNAISQPRHDVELLEYGIPQLSDELFAVLEGCFLKHAHSPVFERCSGIYFQVLGFFHSNVPTR